MGESKSFRKIPSSRVENQLKMIRLRTRKVEKERVAIVYLVMNERYSDSSAVVESRVFLIRRRPRIDIKQDLDAEEI